MKKYILLLFCLGLAAGSLAPYLSAQEVTTEKINAQILPTIWYSFLKVAEGDEIKIYVGVQNNSDFDFTGLVIFYVDDTKIAETIFDSTSDSLEKVSAEWVATNGKHFVQAKIDAKLPENKELLSYETDRAVLEISRVLTLEEVKEETEQILSAIVEKADEAAESFASRLESFKKPISSEIKASESNGSSLPEMEAAPASINNGVVASAYNAGIDLISFLLKEWKWTLASLAVFAIIFSFR